MALLEVCIDSEAGLAAALERGAGRLEVCARLDVGGLTPAAELLELALVRARDRGVPVHAMVRPRANADFTADAAELAELRADLLRVKRQGAHGAVLGILTPEARVDRKQTEELVQLARPMSVTFHRAFDRVRDPLIELDVLIELGIERVLTSGGAATAAAGIPRLRELVEHARGRIIVLPGGGVRAHDAARILAETGAIELHSSQPW